MPCNAPCVCSLSGSASCAQHCMCYACAFVRIVYSTYGNAVAADCRGGVAALLMQIPSDRPTFESLVYRLEDFFHSGEANYTDPSKFVDETENPSEMPAEAKKEEKKLAQPADDGGDDDDKETEDGNVCVCVWVRVA